MTRETVIQGMLKERIVAIARGLNKEQAVLAAKALFEGGIRFMEITFDASGKVSDEDTGSIIAAVAEAMAGKMTVGAGTVLTEKQVETAKAAGGDFIISPDVNAAVIKRTVELGMVSMPGAMTPTEIVTADRCGADFVKVFPAANLGSSYIKAIRGPLNNIRLMAVGGISDINIAEYISAGCVGAGMGGKLVSKKAIEAGDYAALTESARAAVAAAK